MLTRTFQILALLAAVALMAGVSLTVMATGDESGEGGFLHRLHQLHGSSAGHHHAHHMAEMIKELNLTPAQQQRLERIHGIMEEHHGGKSAMHELHNELLAQFERGELSQVELRGMIDEHVEQIRAMFYSVTDEMIGLADELDQTQRQTLLRHVRGANHKAEGAH